jgi:hypothetical protein
VSQLGDVFFVRVWWMADVLRSDGTIALAPRPGARHVQRWRRSLEVFDDRVEPSQRLQARIGDRFVVCGPSLDETVVASVLEIAASGMLVVSLSGPLADTTATVQLLVLAAAPKLRTQKSARRRKARPCLE